MQTKQRMQHFLTDDSGQTTTEYVLILAVILTIIMQFKKKLYVIVTKLLGTLEEKSVVAGEDF